MRPTTQPRCQSEEMQEYVFVNGHRTCQDFLEVCALHFFARQRIDRFKLHPVVNDPSSISSLAKYDAVAAVAEGGCCYPQPPAPHLRPDHHRSTYTRNSTRKQETCCVTHRGSKYRSCHAAGQDFLEVLCNSTSLHVRGLTDSSFIMASTAQHQAKSKSKSLRQSESRLLTATFNMPI